MTEDRIEEVAVIGTGQMGPGIAVTTALAGCRTSLIGRSAESAARGQAAVDAALAFLVEHAGFEAEEAAAASERLEIASDIASAAGADLVVESIAENLPAKQALFQRLEALCAPDAILASNTSGLRISDIAAPLTRPERAVTCHLWNPPHLMPLVEVMQGERTSEETVQRAYRFWLRCGKRPIIGRVDAPGQIGNRLQLALMREALYMVQEGIATPEDIDTALKAGPGLRWPVYGAFEHMDVVGLELSGVVQGIIWPSLSRATEPSPYLRDLVAAGREGVRWGQGIYDWRERNAAEMLRARDLFLAERLKAARAQE
jgi:3-hydroxybutyryl-CoA dehydrogenase